MKRRKILVFESGIFTKNAYPISSKLSLEWQVTQLTPMTSCKYTKYNGSFHIEIVIVWCISQELLDTVLCQNNKPFGLATFRFHFSYMVAFKVNENFPFTWYTSLFYRKYFPNEELLLLNSFITIVNVSFKFSMMY